MSQFSNTLSSINPRLCWVIENDGEFHQQSLLSQRASSWDMGSDLCVPGLCHELLLSEWSMVQKLPIIDVECKHTSSHILPILQQTPHFINISLAAECFQMFWDPAIICCLDANSQTLNIQVLLIRHWLFGTGTFHLSQNFHHCT